MVRIAINPNHRNKMPINADRRWWNNFNGGFANFHLPVDKLIEQIQKGFAYAPQHTGYRKADQFRCGQHIGLDFDTGDDRSTFESLRANSFINLHAAFLHTTASHTPEHPRTRAIFIIDRPLYQREKYTLLSEAFAQTFSTDGADPSCKDPARLFFGAENCEVLNLGNILTLEQAATIVNPYKERLIAKQSNGSSMNGHVNGGGDWLLTWIPNKIESIPDGEKWHGLGRVSRAVGGYVGAGYLDESVAFDTLFQSIASRAEDLGVAKRRIEWGLRVGQEEPLWLEEDKDPLLRQLFG